MRRPTLAVLGLAVSLAVLGPGSTAVAVPTSAPFATHATGGSAASVDEIVKLTDTRSAVYVNSPAMGRVIQVQVLHPAAGGSRPSLYLLDGVSAGEESDFRESTWTQKTDAVAFFADKNINVVLPVGGPASYYTDWLRPDPALGVNQWETFLASELPPIIDANFNGNGINAAAGVSMGAMGAANLVTRHPDLYTGLASYSGCLDNAHPSARLSVRGTVVSRGGDPANMWGPDTDPSWAAHDPLANAEALRGKQIYVSTGNGLPGPYDNGTDLASTIAIGGPLELAAYLCTPAFQDRLSQLGIPATFNYRPNGTHSWPYWQDELRSSWPVLQQALGA
ncbi:mycolyltransferase [Rhodococcus sp. WMMA185]|uniref:alpha/beta hydrolase n=1 Tax=Rhodococcus sp. WMMA185 TaxID=679318 RepID=UPI000877EE9B|nr:alpha/beta hydrolase family protein [Rhodococcus sp. WMMA185]AOW93751.1 mycolyltransferase [Rhodococcus sp. WMMA185]